MKKHKNNIIDGEFENDVVNTEIKIKIEGSYNKLKKYIKNKK